MMEIVCDQHQLINFSVTQCNEKHLYQKTKLRIFQWQCCYLSSSAQQYRNKCALKIHYRGVLVVQSQLILLINYAASVCYRTLTY